MAKALTVKAIEAVKPGSARREIPDGLLVGLYLVCQPSGALSWAVRYRVAGIPKKLTLGTYPAINLASARQLAGQTLTAVAEGRDPSAEKKVARRVAREAPKDDVAAVVDLYIERYAKTNLRESSRKEAERLLKKEVVGAWRGRSIKSITRRDVVDLLDGIIDRGAAVTANRVLAAVRRLFNWSIDRGVIEVSPIAGMKAPTVERSRDRVLSDDELRRVLRAADRLGWPFGPFVHLLALTGQRLSEVGEMSWGEIDREKAVWVIPAHRAKNGVAHVVHLSPQALAVLDALPRIANGAKDSPLVFTTTGRTPVSGWSNAKDKINDLILAELREESDDAGNDPNDVRPLPDWRFHDLRRTMASGMARLGVQIHVVEKILNHVSGSFGGIVGVYQRHDFDAEKKAALLAWGRHVASLEAPAEANVIELRGRRDGQ